MSVEISAPTTTVSAVAQALAAVTGLISSGFAQMNTPEMKSAYIAGINQHIRDEAYGDWQHGDLNAVQNGLAE